MFRFEHPEYFWLAIIIPLVIAGVLYALKRSRAIQAQIGEHRLLSAVVPGFNPQRHKLKTWLWVPAITCIIVALTNPQLGTKKEMVEKKSADILIAMDISRSMLAEDVPPSRLDMAKRFTDQLIDALKQERIGLILFAGNAYLQMPLTNDYAAAKIYARAINTEAAGTQGTSIKDAIDLAVEASDIRDRRNGALLIISDGEDHEEGVDEAVLRAIDAGLVIHTIGVGSKDGGYIPVQYGNRLDYLRDESGSLVRTTFNEEMLRSVASAGNGSFFNLLDRSAVDDIKSEIDNLDKVAVEQRSFSEYNSYYGYFLAMGSIFMALIYILPDKSTEYRVQSREYRVQSTEYRVPNTDYRIP